MKPVHSSHLYCIKYSFLQKQIFSANSLKTAQPSYLSTLYLDKALFLFVFCRISDSTNFFPVSTYKKRLRKITRSLKKRILFALEISPIKFTDRNISVFYALYNCCLFKNSSANRAVNSGIQLKRSSNPPFFIFLSLLSSPV